MDDLQKMMQELSEADGVPGFEREIRMKMEAYLKPVSDEILTDRLGGIVGKKVGQADGPKILFTGHLDEVGWMVTYITEKGFLRMQALGGWWPHVMLAQRVRVKSRKGDHIGIIGSKAPHVLPPEDRNKVMQIKDMFVDVGAKSPEEVAAMGIRVGDPIIPASDFFTMRDGEVWAGKALDNRAGCALAVEIMKKLQGENHPNVLFGGGTIQEEVGTRGAQIMANLVQPDIAFAFDVGLAYDTPGFEMYQASANMGDGPLMLVYDATMVPHVGLRDLMMDTAEELGINLQLDALAGGGTDGAKFHLSGIGCPTVVLGFATRYIHSHTALLSRKDFEQAAELGAAVIKKLSKEKVAELYQR